MTTADKIATYRRKIEGRAVRTIVRVVETSWDGVTPQGHPDTNTDTLDIFPDGTMTLNGTRILKSELPAWAKKYA